MAAETNSIQETVHAGAEESREAGPSRGLALLGLFWISAVIVAGIIVRPAPASPSGDYFTLCGFKLLTGLPCPGCGLTHSFCAIGKGDFTTAVQFNLLGPALFLLLLSVWARSIAVLLNRFEAVARFDRIFDKYRIVKRTATAFVLFGVARIAAILIFRTSAFEESPLGRIAHSLFGK